MNHWRLLLLAFVAVFQPIAPFNDHLVDGRQECSDRQIPTLLRDTRSPLYDTYRHDKASSPALLVHHIAYREQRQIQRRDLSHRKSIREILSDSQERNIRKVLPGTARLARDARRLERDTYELNRFRGSGGLEVERTSRNIPDSRTTRNIREFAARTTETSQDGRHNIESIRSSSYRARIADERSSRKIIGFGGNFDRTRSELSQDRQSHARDNVARVPHSLDSQVNERRSASGTNRRESSLRLDVRSRITDDRDNERHIIERRSRSESIISIRRVHDSSRLFRSERDSRRAVTQERQQYDQRNVQGFRNRVSVNLLSNDRLNVRRDLGNDASARSRITNRIRDHRTLAQDSYESRQENIGMFRSELDNERLSAGKIENRRQTARSVSEDRQIPQRNVRNIRNDRSVDRLNNGRFEDRRRDTNLNSKARLSNTMNRRNNFEFVEYNPRRNANNKIAIQETNSRRMERNNKNAPESVFRFNENVAEITNRRIQGRQATNSEQRLTKNYENNQSFWTQRISRTLSSLENLAEDRRAPLNNRQNARDVTKISRENTNQSGTRHNYSEKLSRGNTNDDVARRYTVNDNRLRVREEKFLSRDGSRKDYRDENYLWKSQGFLKTERVKSLQNRAESSGHQNARDVRNLSGHIKDLDNTIRERDISRNRVDIRDNDRTRERQMDNRLNDDMSRKKHWRFDKQVDQENGYKTGTWQIAFYTLQAVYLIGLLLHLPKLSGNSKMNSRYWPFTTPAHVKVD